MVHGLFPFQFREDDKRQPIQKLVDAVRRACASGRIKRGDKIPSVRTTAFHLGISPTTVADAYAQLKEAGLLHAEGALGTFVAVLPTDHESQMGRLSELKGLVNELLVQSEIFQVDIEVVIGQLRHSAKVRKEQLHSRRLFNL